jgi:hypothetical protein
MSKQTDSDKAAELLSAALSEISSETIHKVLGYFSTVDPSALLKNPDKYFEEWFELVDEARKQSWAIGQAYYRLDSAIWTGTTPDDGTGEILSLKQLWVYFLKLIGVGRFTSTLPNSDIKLEDSSWGDYDKDFSRRNAGSSFFTRAVHRLRKFDTANRSQLDADDYLDRLEKLMGKVTADMARESQRLAQNGGRDAVAVGAANTKGRRVGYMRVPQGSYTCGFCIMLASRGAVYHTKAAAGFKGVGREYHPGCDCLVRPFYEGQTEPRVVQDAKRAWSNFGGGSAKDFVKWWKDKTNED